MVDKTRLVSSSYEESEAHPRKAEKMLSRQKSIIDVRRRDIEFEVDSWLYLNISPMKGFMRFIRRKTYSLIYFLT